MKWLQQFLAMLFPGRPEAPAAPPPAPVPGVPVLVVGEAPPPAITAELLTRLGWTAPAAWAAALAAPARAYGILATPRRLPAFLAQVGHESQGGLHTREIWGPTPAQRGYEGRRDLGNVVPGDGERFLGRSLIHISGRANVTAARDALRPGMDLMPFCAWLESRAGAAEASCWWWARHGCNTLADSGDFEALTRRINGGLTGLADRQDRWAEAKAALNL